MEESLDKTFRKSEIREGDGNSSADDMDVAKNEEDKVEKSQTTSAEAKSIESNVGNNQTQGEETKGAESSKREKQLRREALQRVLQPTLHRS